MDKIKYCIRTDQNEIFKTEKGLFNYVIKLEQQVKKQKEVINKTIEYIEKFIPIEEDTIIMRERQREYLLDILKEVSE